MKRHFLSSNYDKTPAVRVRKEDDRCWMGWADVSAEINRAADVLGGGVRYVVVECYNGVQDGEVLTALAVGVKHVRLVNSCDAMRSAAEIDALLKDDITDDEIFGYMTRRHIDCYFDAAKVAHIRTELAALKEGIVLLYGVGAAWVAPRIDLLVYANMARWEIQLRYRRGEVGNIGVDNRTERASLKYKRGFFVDWRICDRFKKELMPKWNYLLDTHVAGTPKLVTGDAVRHALEDAVKRPFRVVPFFDPGPWGGQWMKEVCDLDRNQQNFAWCFDCVPEENSLLLRFSKSDVEIPSIDLVFAQPRALLGEAVHGRFGDEFPIRLSRYDGWREPQPAGTSPHGIHSGEVRNALYAR